MRIVVPLLFLLLALGADRILVLALRERYGRWARRLLAGSAAWSGAVLLLGITIPHSVRMSPAFALLCTLPAAASLAAVVLLVTLSPLWAPASAAARLGSASGGLTRRQVLRAAAVIPPAAVAAAGPLSMLNSGTAPMLNRITLAFPDLPPELDGLKVVQLSDAHVGYFIRGEDIVAAAPRIAAEKPDLLLVTGDLIDDLSQLDGALEALGTIPTRLGSFACLGNHEYYAGTRTVRKAFDRSRVHMMVDERLRLGALELSAADYPMVRGRGREAAAFVEHAGRSIGPVEPGVFRLHMAHHPHAWDAAREKGADLTLSGHTHGGQIALLGRMVLEPIFRYVSGVYEEGDQRLYVSRGFGHWLPVRIACPTEIGIITLRRGQV